MEFSAISANELFETAAGYLMLEGLESAPRGLKIKELLNTTLILQRPGNNIVHNKFRKISRKYLVAELLWYLSTDLSDRFIGKYAPFWKKLADCPDMDGMLNSNYGFYFFAPMDDVINLSEQTKINLILRNQNKYHYKDIQAMASKYDIDTVLKMCGSSKLIYALNPTANYLQSQFDYVLNKLTEDPDSRQAVVNINNVLHKSYETKDFPCTTAMQFFIRDGKLYMTVTMRSTDIVLGYCNDVYQFTQFQRILLDALNRRGNEYTLGTFTLFTGSLHVYERHFEMLSNVIRNKEHHDHNKAMIQSVNDIIDKYDTQDVLRFARNLVGFGEDIIKANKICNEIYVNGDFENILSGGIN